MSLGEHEIMPTYLYHCSVCETKVEIFCTIAEMEEFESEPQIHEETNCIGELKRIFASRKHITFKEGFYEHLTDDGVYVSRPQDLVDICKATNATSSYMADLGGLFGAKENKWV